MSEKGLQIHQVRIGANGRVTIPAVLRQRHKMRPGDRVEWRTEDGRLVMTPLKSAHASGKTKHRGA